VGVGSGVGVGAGVKLGCALYGSGAVGIGACPHETSSDRTINSDVATNKSLVFMDFPPHFL
jgi:hypothetical protein